MTGCPVGSRRFQGVDIWERIRQRSGTDAPPILIVDLVFRVPASVRLPYGIADITGL
jgi:hypothetical protein